MRPHRLSIIALVAPLAAAAAQQTPAKRAFTPADWYRVTQVSTPALSPDGGKVAFTVTTVREAENKRHSEVWVVPTNGGEAARYTSPAFESSNPRFSEDGKILYFTSQRPGGRGSQWALRMDQPAGEAYQPPAAPPSPGGSQPADKSFTIISDAGFGFSAFGGRGGGRGGETPGDSLSPNDPYARMKPISRPPWNAVTKPENPARFDGRQIVDMNYKANGVAELIPGPRTEPRRDSARVVQLQMVRAGQTERKNLTNAKYSHRAATVSPDGKWIAFLADSRLRPDSVVTAERDSIAKLPPDRKRDELPRNDTDIYLLPVAACEAHTAECTPRRIEYAGNEQQVAWSPDSKQLAFTGRAGQFKNLKLFTVAVEGGKPVDMLGAWGYEPGVIQWLKDGRIVMSTSIGGSRGLHAIDPMSKKITPVLGGRRVLQATFDAAQSKIVYVASDMTHPSELYIADADGSNERKLTSFNDKVNSEVAWSEAEQFTYPSVGGLKIEGWLMKPYGYEPSKKYPVVLYIHGGPHSEYNEGWFDEFQNLAGAGFFVLFTNPRGSSSINTEFTYASRGDWGGKDYEDLMKAVDIVAKRPDVDSTRMGVTGGSYGGFMTAWITTKTNRFKAAQADRMISDWNSWYGTTDVQGLTEGEFFGRPWENQIMYDTLSPIRFVKKVKTPTLIVQSEEDYRTPMNNADTWFMALKKLGVPAEFVRYPRSNHDLSRTGEPWLLVDRLGRLRQWFSYWLKEKPAAANAAESRGGPR